MPFDQQQQFSKRKDNKYFSESLDTTTSSSRQKLQHLFHEIEKEFDSITRENLILQEKVDLLNEKLENVTSPNDKSIALDSSKKVHMRSSSFGGQKMKTAYKLKAQTSKIVSSFKAPLLHGVQIREFSGHKDGIWEVSVAQMNGLAARHGLFATASADHSAIVWSTESGKSLLSYQGHKGSVNSVRFHSTKDLVITSSGDCTAHLWQTNIDTISPKMASSEEDIVESNDETLIVQGIQQSNVTKTNLIEFEGHTGPVVAADFVANNDQLITASWDRTAHLHDIEHKSIVTTLIGHDQELTNVATHPYQKMAATASKDTTFRLWDFRETVQAVSVFQGHSESVNCVVFVGDDKMISSSDDRTVKIWDLKNMRSALVTITTVSANNRVSVSNANVVAIAHDDRQIRLFDLNGQRLARLPRSSRVGHRLMVTSTSWLSDSCLLSSSFDRRVLLWQIQSSASSSKTSKAAAPKDKDGEF